MIKKTAFLFLFLMSNLAHAVYVQIHFNRPILGRPDIVVSTSYDDSYTGPFHVCLFSTVAGQLYLNFQYSYSNIIEANVAHQHVVSYVLSVFNAPLQVNYIDLVSNYDSFSFSQPYVSQHIQTQKVNNTTLPSIPEEPIGNLLEIEDKQKEEKKSVKKFKRTRCFESPNDINLYDSDDDDELKDWRQIPDFSYATLSSSHIEFFK